MQNLSNKSSESSQNHTNYYNWTMSTYNKIDKKVKNISMDIRNGQISISNTTMGTAIERNGSTILKSGATDSRWTYRLGHHSAHSCGVVDEKTKQLRPLRIIMGTSEKYIPVVLNWLIYFHIVCADRSTLYFLCLVGKYNASTNLFVVLTICLTFRTRRLNLQCKSTVFNVLMFIIQATAITNSGCFE